MRNKLIQSYYQQSISISALAWIESIVEMLKNKQSQKINALKLTDQQITRLILFLLEHPDIEDKEILDLLIRQELLLEIKSGFLKNYVLIHLAEITNLKAFLDENARIHLAYNALHASPDLRSHLFKYLKNFEITNLSVLADLGYKAILLGNMEDFDILSFQSLPFKQILQLLYLISNKCEHKAKKEAQKISSLYPKQKNLLGKFINT
jgi:hypothetical protein